MRKTVVMATAHRIAPIFSVRDLGVALGHYQRLGFAVRAYTAGYGYGFASRDGVEIHLHVMPDHDRRPSSAYLFVDDADALAAAWHSTGVEVLHTPQDTDWGQREGAVVDPDGNIIRFGSPMKAASSGVA
ncbi:VOC family protein [Catenulispora rubra]|uniref:VOC family protein n=1 Tax=Catenulispora rubra TaxID=280293 RepID=UPI002B275877|nr:VOC family protein [Catenulispora rubra]